MTKQLVTYERERLYTEVWNEPSTTVAKRYQISSTALAKICARLHVPKPERGYWNKRAMGQQVDPPPPLPTPENIDATVTVVRKGRRPNRERVTESLDAGRASMGSPIIVPDVLETPHQLVAAALLALSRGKIHHGLISSPEERCLDLSASPAILPRALRIMNALILALEERGFPVEVTDVLPEDTPDRDERSNVTRVLVTGEWIRFGIVERLRQHHPSSASAVCPPGLKGKEREFWLHWNRPRMTLVPSGALSLEIKEESLGVRVSWRDERRPLDVRLNEFIKHLFVAADAKKQAREADHSWRAAFDVEARRKREQRLSDERQALKLADLRDTILRWNEAREIRAFVRELRGAPSQPRDAERLSWAEAYADAIDPTRLAMRES